MKEFKKIDTDGTISYYNEEGQLHRDGDKPAIIYSDGTKVYYVKGKLHRDGDEPAIIQHDGRKEWYQDGKLHREGNKPALIWPDGTKEYYRNGVEYKLSIWEKMKMLFNIR